MILPMKIHIFSIVLSYMTCKTDLPHFSNDFSAKIHIEIIKKYDIMKLKICGPCPALMRKD